MRPSLRNHLCGLWNWAVAKGYAEATPFNRGGRVPEELKKEPEPPRDRRLVGDEEKRLLARKLEAGWPLHAVSRWLGHSKLTTTDIYLNATTQLLHGLNERKPLVLIKS